VLDLETMRGSPAIAVGLSVILALHGRAFFDTERSDTLAKPDRSCGPDLGRHLACRAPIRKETSHGGRVYVK